MPMEWGTATDGYQGGSLPDDREQLHGLHERSLLTDDEYRTALEQLPPRS